MCDVFPSGSEDLKAAIAFYWIILPKDNLKDSPRNVNVKCYGYLLLVTELQSALKERNISACWELIREIVRENNVPLFNDEWIDPRSTEMFVQQWLGWSICGGHRLCPGITL